MNAIKDIIRLVKTGRITRPEKIRPFNREREQKTLQFYKAVSAGKYGTEAAAVKDLYPGDPEEAGRLKFNMLKKRLKERLYAAVLFPREGRYGAKSYEANFIYCQRHYFVARMLLFFAASGAGYSLMRKVLARATAYGLNDIALLCTLALRRDALVRGDTKLFTEYNELLAKAQATIAAETEAETVYYEMLIPFSRKLNVQPGTHEKMKEGLEKIEGIYKAFPIWQVRLLLINTKILYAHVEGAYKRATDLCDEAIMFLEAAPETYTVVLHGNFLLKKTDSLTLLRNYGLSTACVKQCLDFFPAESSSWFIVKEFHFIACINSNKLAEAAEIYLECHKNMRLKENFATRQEIWYINRGYLWFLLTCNGERALRDRVFKKMSNFPIGNLENSVNIYARDKNGMNISLVVLKTILLLQGKKKEKEFSALMRNTESLKNHLTANMNDENIRERGLVKILIAVSENEFSLIKVHTRIKRLITYLEKTDRTLTAAQAKNEIIAYPALAKIVVEMMGGKVKRKVKKAKAKA